MFKKWEERHFLGMQELERGIVQLGFLALEMCVDEAFELIISCSVPYPMWHILSFYTCI